MEAGPGWLVQRWSRDDGIPATHVADVAQTPDGMVWLATYGGLVRFDGLTFEVVDTSAARLPANVFTAVTVAPDGWLWAATENHGLVSLRDGVIRGHAVSARSFIESPEGLWIGSTDRVYAAEGGDLRALTPPGPGPVFGAARDAHGRIWLGLGAQGLARVEGARVLPGPTPTAPGGGRLAVRTLTLVGPRIWLTTEGGLYTLDDAGLHRHEPSAGVGFHSLEAVGGRLFAGTDQGVLRVTPDRLVPVESLDPVGPTETALRRPAAALPDGTPLVRGLRTLYLDKAPILRSDAPIRALRAGRQGDAWVTTAAGELLRVSPRHIEVLPGTESNAYGLLEDRQGDLWVATLDQGLLRFRQGRPVAAGLTGRHTWTLAEAPDGGVWVGAYGLCRLTADGCVEVPEVVNEQVRALAFDRRGQLWIGAANGLFLRADGVTRPAFPPGQGPRQPVRVVYESADGDLWLGTFGDGLYQRHGASGALRHFGPASGLPGVAIRDIWPDPDGSLWLATEDAGLVRVRDPGGEPRFSAVGRAQGLPVAGVHRILPDDQGRLWLSSNQGILLVDRATLHAVADRHLARLPVEVFGPRDGVPHAEANGGVQGAGLRTRDGRLLFPTQAGVAVIDPARHPVAAPAPTPVIDTVVVGGQARRLHGDAIELPLGGRDLTFTFTAATSQHPEQVRFSYRLEGYDADWVEAGTRRAAFFTQVPPGHYRLAVRAQAPTGAWSAATLSPQVVVPPRFFEQGWFFVLMGLVGAGAVALIIRLGLARARAREVALAALVAERTAETVRQAEALRALDELKTRFFAHISHELRTPLTVIGGFIDQLREAEAPPEQAVALDAMRRNTRRLHRLTNQILELERGAIGARHAHPRPLSLARLAEAVVQSFRSVAEDRLLANEVAADAVALADPEMVESVLTNLVSNAVKFTGAAGRITVAGRRAGGAVWLEVADDGRGIPAADLPHIFDRFYRVRSPELRHGEGSGLGLALVRELVRQLGGDVAIESTLGVGTAVRLTLPAADADAEGVAFGRVAEVEASLLAEPARVEDHVVAGRPEVLVVDDNPDLRLFVGALLAETYTVRHCADGQSALERARAWPPDLVVADVMMPGLDGFGLARALGEDPETASIPVLLLTARADTAAQVEGLGAGAVDFLGKPFAPDVLLARVTAIFRRTHRLRDALRRQHAEAQAPAAAAPGGDDDDDVVARARAAILAHLDDEALDVPTLARLLGMSRATLTRRFAGTPHTPAALIRQVRLERAQTLLREGAGNVSDVAYAVGFASLAQFSRSFKEAYGVPPSSLLPGADLPENL